ncbi:hypothetical protein DFH94DRAFT_19582 [Russula ochroleuca]|jgi:hypothetical protein|uniref:Uncharacterized protein n=1 Tax=Russula ochroleuca TaxID=152965 RepID=A0A9P5N6C1_9AGAM|nr:hypothetical protein DFH94DRAFT_19582 [Russula ochroleuca]
MVNWQNPVTIAHELTALIKLVHVVDGIYIWEFICNLGFEWSLASRRRQWRWTVAFYIATRLATLSDVATELIGMNLTEEFNCKTWTYFLLFFRYGASSLALSLYALRGIAIWQRSIPVTVLSSLVVLANVGTWIHRITKADAVWVPALETCMFVKTHPAIFSNCMLLGAEIFFIALMATGIYNHNPGPRAFNIMYREGLLWLVAAILVEIVPVVFLILNLNDVMNVMYIAPSVLCTSIGATRMYRNLSDRQSGNILDFWETSRDETTGEIRFRRQTQYVARGEGQGDSASSTALPMGRLVRAQPLAEERFVERFEARDIELDDDSESMPDKKPSMAIEDDKLEPNWVHAK